MPRAVAALRIRNFRIWMASCLLSTTGSWMQLVAQNWLILRLTHSGGALGLCVSLQAVPAFAGGLWGGSLADRLPTRWLLRRTQAAFAVLAATLAVLTATGAVRPVHVLVLAFLAGCVSVVDAPASGRLGAELVGPELLGNAIALGSATSSTGRVLGMAVAGIVVAAIGPSGAFAINAVSFLAVLAGLALLRESEIRPLARAEEERGGATAALRHLRTDRRLQSILALAFVCGSFGRNYQVTMALMNELVFRRGAGGYGLFSTVFAVGALVGAVAAARMPRPSLRLLFAVAAAGCGLEVLAGLAPGPVTFAAVLVPIAMSAVVLDTAVSALAQLGTPEAMRGRVLALVSLTGGAAGAVGAPALGAIATFAGPRASLVVGGLVVAAAWVAIAARLRAGRSRMPRLGLAFGASNVAGAPSAPTEVASRAAA